MSAGGSDREGAAGGTGRTGVSILPTLRLLAPGALLVGVALAGVLLGFWVNRAFFPGTTPEQPIEFSHRIHAGDNAIPCLYCHAQARRAAVAGVPSVAKCMGCHRVVARDRPLIRRVAQYYANEEPIPWIKVHDLPDFVHFPHKRHVLADIACQTCHGPVETMERVTRLAPTKMGLCRDCHAENQVVNGQDCWTCHK
jgi:hypothetical protein